MTAGERLVVWGVAGLPEVQPGDDVAALLTAAEPALADGDVVVVTSKIVSKAEGRLVAGTRDDHLAAETARVVAVRGATQIVATHHGLVLAAAGIDASNVPAGTVALLPIDPDASAERIRSGIRERLGVAVAVVVSDTMGRPWRNGLVDQAIGASGLDVLWDLRGSHDAAGHRLEATVVAVADELAAAADLVKGKLSSTPAAVVRGFPLRRPGPDADADADDRGNADQGNADQNGRALVRVDADDMFRLGTREAMAEVVAGSAPLPVASAGRSAALASRAEDVDGVRRAAATVTTGGVRLDVRADSAAVLLVAVTADDPLLAGVVVGRLLAALAAEGLRGSWPAEVEDATTAVLVLRD